MSTRRVRLVADVSSDRPAALRPILEGLGATITPAPGGFHIEAELEGDDARQMNRQLLSELRRAERRTRLRAEWFTGGVVHKFFDYVPKGTRHTSGD